MRSAARISRRAAQRYPLLRRSASSGLWLLTDPQRSVDLKASVARLPPGSVVILRMFGAPDSVSQVAALRRMTRRRKVLLLIGADAVLARKVKADGVHLPQRLAYQAGRLVRAHPAWLITAAAHGFCSRLRAERAGAAAVLLSCVFPSRSPSAKAPLGAVRFQALVRRAAAPVIALGGMTATKATRLSAGAAAGVAGVQMFNEADRY